MEINKIAWLTDIHLNFLNSTERKKFYNQVDKTDSDAILITGDIAEAPSICEVMHEFSVNTTKHIYFVLGNHDYYRGNVSDVRSKIIALCSKNNRITWLGKPEIIRLNKYTALVGQDGWADARYGDFDRSPVSLNDSHLISELFQAFLLSKSALKNEMQKLADKDSEVLFKTLTDAITANIKKMIIATHVPPFTECCWYKDMPSDKDWLPYFSSKATGDAISIFAKENKNIDFLVLCGHTHTGSTVKVEKNLEVRTGLAEYYRPKLQEIVKI
jgi:predicted phosphohydrolase